MDARAVYACVIGLAAAVAFGPGVASAQTSGDAQYGGVSGVTAESPPAAAPPAPAPEAAPENDVAGVTASSPETAPVVAERGTLPFTGFDLLVTLMAGGLLVGLGFALNSASRRAPRPA